jgi:hypothetical protein
LKNVPYPPYPPLLKENGVEKKRRKGDDQKPGIKLSFFINARFLG